MKLPSVTLLLLLATGCAPSQDPPSGAAPATRPAGGVTLSDVNGLPHRPLESGAKATVLIFLMHDCPACNGYAPEISRLATVYGSEGVAVYGVNVEADLPEEEARRHAEAYKLACPVLLDRRHELVKLAGVSVTPEAAVFDVAGRLVYRGRIDDRYVGLGKSKGEPAVRDVRNVLDALLAGKAVEFTSTKAFGCYVTPPEGGAGGR